MVVMSLHAELQAKQRVGAWRSLVAYLNGVQRAGGSNPLAPTSFLSHPNKSVIISTIFSVGAKA